VANCNAMRRAATRCGELQ